VRGGALPRSISARWPCATVADREANPLSAKLELAAAVAATGVARSRAHFIRSPSKVPSMAEPRRFATSHRQRRYPRANIEFSACVRASPTAPSAPWLQGLRSRSNNVVAATTAFQPHNVGRRKKAAPRPPIRSASASLIAHDSDVTVPSPSSATACIPITHTPCSDGPTPPASCYRGYRRSRTR